MLTFFYIIIAISVFSLAFTSISLAPWVPTRKRDLKRAFELTSIKPGDTFYDLGCGDGITVIYANKKYNTKSIGIELALPLFIICKIKQIFIKNNNIQFKLKNIYKENLENADVIYIFGLDFGLEKLKTKLERELKPNTRVVTYSFPIKGWQPKKISKNSEKDLPIYLYII